MSSVVSQSLLAVIFVIVAALPYLAWKIGELDEDRQFYERRRYVRIYLAVIVTFIIIWCILFFKR